jgi:uncharacterized protein
VRPLKIAILAASGRTGRALVREALRRGHDVTALARDPAKVPFDVRKLAVDVLDAASVRRALGPDDLVVSGLGAERAGVLAAGARAVLDARPARVVWLGAYGTGPSAAAAGWATRALLSLMGPRIGDKVRADALVLAAGGTVFHAGPLADGDARGHETVALAAAPRRFFPARVPRAAVAAAMLDEIETPRFVGAVAVPLARP